MAKKHSVLTPTGTSAPVERMELEGFAKRLHRAMLKKQLSQSDLARQIWGTVTDNRGYEVAKNRDRISVWLRGQATPDPQNLTKCAEVLGLKVEELAPDLTASAVERQNPEVQMTAMGGHSDKVYLRINKLVSMAVAAKIVAMIAEAEGG